MTINLLMSTLGKYISRWWYFGSGKCYKCGWGMKLVNVRKNCSMQKVYEFDCVNPDCDGMKDVYGPME